jgi:hypothetical protein
VPLTVGAHIEQGHQKDREMHELKEQMNNMHQDFKSYDGLVKQVLDKVKDERKR